MELSNPGLERFANSLSASLNEELSNLKQSEDEFTVDPSGLHFSAYVDYMERPYDGIIDDDPSFGTTNSTGQINWLLSYTEALNAGDGNDPESYADFTSTIILNLLDPLQTASDGVDVLLVKTELNDNP